MGTIQGRWLRRLHHCIMVRMQTVFCQDCSHRRSWRSGTVFDYATSASASCGARALLRNPVTLSVPFVCFDRLFWEANRSTSACCQSGNESSRNQNAPVKWSSFLREPTPEVQPSPACFISRQVMARNKDVLERGHSAPLMPWEAWSRGHLPSQHGAGRVIGNRFIRSAWQIPV